MEWVRHFASDEAGIFDFQKQAIVDAEEDGTTISRAVTGKPARIIRSLWTDYWVREGKEPLTMPYQGVIVPGAGRGQPRSAG